MTTHKLTATLLEYEEYLKKGYNCTAKQLEPHEYQNPVVSPESMREHLLWMIHHCVYVLIPSGDINEIIKANRWLGYIQGELRAMREFSIAQLRDHSRS